MNRTLVRWLLRAYPAVWRERYGQEFADLLRAAPGGPRTVLDVLCSALREHWSPPPQSRPSTNTDFGSVLSLLREPSAFAPMAMSVSALTVVAASLARFGVPPPHSDEGFSAHTWQLLMLLQIPCITWFVLKCTRKTPRLALGILAIQLALALAAIAPVYILGL